MALLTILYWRDIPAQVIVKQGRKNAKRELPLRFTEAIDMCAMRTGAADTDAYLEEWRRGEPQEVSGDIETEADSALARLDTEYDKQRLVQLVNQGGLENAK
ncbi:MAG: virulence factor [Rhizobiaceae bacterium]